MVLVPKSIELFKTNGFFKSPSIPTASLLFAWSQSIRRLNSAMKGWNQVQKKSICRIY